MDGGIAHVCAYFVFDQFGTFGEAEAADRFFNLGPVHRTVYNQSGFVIATQRLLQQPGQF